MVIAIRAGHFSLGLPLYHSGVLNNQPLSDTMLEHRYVSDPMPENQVIMSVERLATTACCTAGVAFLTCTIADHRQLTAF
jgi:hypothetical protein